VTTYQVMPPLTADEYADLRADIAANGVRVPIDVTEDGEILDGHHRFEIAQELNVYCPTRVIAGLSEDEKVAHAYSVNLARRQLSREAKRALVAASLARDPGLSDRQHAERTGVSPTTAGAVRGEMEDSGQLSKLDSRTSADGRQRPAQQPTRPAEWTCDECGSAFKTEHTHCATCGDHYPAPEVCTAHHDIVNTETGEIVDPAAHEPLTRVPSQDLADAADIFHRAAKVAEVLGRRADFLADTWATGSELERRTWRSTLDSLTRNADAIANRIDSTPTLRRIK